MAAGKKTTLNELGEMIRHLVTASADFTTKDDIKNFATKDDLARLEKNLTIKIEGVDNKVAGTNRRLDTEAMWRTDLKLPRRVHDLEEEVYGIGSSKHPKHVPL